MRQYSLSSGSAEPTPASGKRAPVRPVDSWRPRSSAITHAELFIERSGVLPVLEPKLDSAVGRPRFLSVKGLLVGMMLNGIRDEHSAQITCIAATIDAMPKNRLREMGCRTDRWPRDLYKRVDDLFNRLFRVLKDGFIAKVDGEEILIDHVWFSNRIGASPITDDIVTTRSVAIDGTAIETAACLIEGSDEVVHDGEAAEGQPVDENGRAPKGQDRPKAQVLGYGVQDRRKVYTKDPDARGGYRTSTARRTGGTYVGYEAHFSVQTRDVVWTNGADKATLSDPVPGVIVNHALVPAGSSRTAAVTPLLLDPRLTRFDINDVVVDPGYTIANPDGFFTPLRKAGIHVTWQVTSHHAKTRPFNDNAFVYNEHLISETLPARLRDLPQPPIGSKGEKRRRAQEPWNEVARYRYSPHGKTSATGVTRYRDPIDAGRLRSRDVPASMRRPPATPLVELPDPDGYEKTLRASAEDLPRHSKYLTGTTAHDIAYYARRNVAESANSALRGDFVDLDGRHFNVFELGRINILLGFTIAGYNRRRIRAFCAAHGVDDPNDPPPSVDTPDIEAPMSLGDDEPRDDADPPDESRSSAG